MRKVVGSFDDHARFVIPSRGPFRIPWWTSLVVELDRSHLVVRGSADRELMREPLTAVVEFRAGQWEARAPGNRLFGPSPAPTWTLFAHFDDGRVVPLDLDLRDAAEATKWASDLTRALERIRAPKTYRE